MALDEVEGEDAQADHEDGGEIVPLRELEAIVAQHLPDVFGGLVGIIR